MMEKLTIVKIGGKVIDDEASLDHFLSDFASLPGRKILVHGGGKIASDIGSRMGIAPVYHEGRRITDKPTLDLVTMVYGGLVNKKIVAKLQALDQNALGLTGADGNMLLAKKRPVKDIDYGFAGDVSLDSVNASGLISLFEAGFIPVLCALTHDGEGSMLNTNADTIASVIAGGLGQRNQAVQLIYCFEQPGVLSDFEAKTVIAHINHQIYTDLIQSGIINEGMIPKMDNAFDALNAGVTVVKIGHFSDIASLASGAAAGTKITWE